MDKQLTPEQIENIKQAIIEIDTISNDHSLIQDNKVYFGDKDISYRCKMPNQREQSEAENARVQYKLTLMNTGKYLTKNQQI